MARPHTAEYECSAASYDRAMGMLERLALARWRARMWAQVQGDDLLEVGVGTGKNMPYYPAGAHVIAVDVNERMLARARQRAAELGLDVDLRVMDAQTLSFPDGCFDAAVASLVFCSVRDPVAGLRELGRVVKPGGYIHLLEHMRVEQPVLGRCMDWLDGLVARHGGEHIARRTVENVRQAGLRIERVESVAPSGLVRLIVAVSE